MIRLTSLLLVTFLLAGCGYKLGEIRPTPMRSVRNLAVPNFKNKTYQPRVEVLMADTLIKELQLDGTYTITSDSTADAILDCTLTKIEERSIRSVQNDVLATAEFQMTLTVAFRVYDRVTGVTLMEGTVTGTTPFFSNNDLETTKRQAIPLATSNMAVQLTSRLAEGW